MCGLRSLRGLWGFCARVELGGLKACGVFAFRFILLSFFVLRFVLLLSSFPAPIVANFQTNRAKGAKVRFYLVWLGVFSGKSETRKGKI